MDNIQTTGIFLSQLNKMVIKERYTDCNVAPPETVLSHSHDDVIMLEWVTNIILPWVFNECNIDKATFCEIHTSQHYLRNKCFYCTQVLIQLL